jgi:CBS domain-containing protein
MRARDIMTSPVHVIWRNAPVESAAELMAAASVTALPVVDANGELVGMVSEGDVLRQRVPPDPTAHLLRPAEPAGDRPATVGEVMSGDPLTTEPEADVADVADTMLRHDVRSMPVLVDGAVVGIISRRDILRAVVRGDDVLTLEVQHRLDEFADGPRRWTAVVRGGTATVSGGYADETERAVVQVLARTVPGIAAVEVGAAGPG